MALAAPFGHLELLLGFISIMISLAKVTFKNRLHQLRYFLICSAAIDIFSIPYFDKYVNG